ncbi:hypothetical protein CFOL_v3_04579, partial [Cephalotus follicularis]
TVYLKEKTNQKSHNNRPKKRNQKRTKMKPFLSSSVPNLSLDDLAIDSQALSSKLNPNSRLRLQIKLILCKPREQVGFTHTRVPNQHQLEQVIILIFRFVTSHVCSINHYPSERERVFFFFWLF